MFKVVVRMLAGRFNDFSGSDCAAGVLERLAHNRAKWAERCDFSKHRMLNVEMRPQNPLYVPIDGCYDSINVNADVGWLAYDSCVDFTDPTTPKMDWRMFDHVEAWKWIVTELRAFTPKTGRKLDAFDFRVRMIPE